MPSHPIHAAGLGHGPGHQSAILAWPPAHTDPPCWDFKEIGGECYLVSLWQNPLITCAGTRKSKWWKRCTWSWVERPWVSKMMSLNLTCSCWHWQAAETPQEAAEANVVFVASFFELLKFLPGRNQWCNWLLTLMKNRFWLRPNLYVICFHWTTSYLLSPCPFLHRTSFPGMKLSRSRTTAAPVLKHYRSNLSCTMWFHRVCRMKMLSSPKCNLRCTTLISIGDAVLPSYH